MSEEIYYDMHKTFDMILPRVLEAVRNSDLESIFKRLSEIKGATLVSGVGGSSVAATYLTKVLNKKNKIISTFAFPRDLLYMDLSGYENVISCSYSGRNVGVDVSFDNDLNKYLYSIGHRDNATDLRYRVLDEEYSFVSLAGTLIPMAIAFLYYTGDEKLLKEILSKRVSFDADGRRVYEVLYGQEDLTAARLLESTITEGALGEAVLHEKYNMCHGRIMHQHAFRDSALIYFTQESELDDVFRKNTLPYFDKTYILERKYEDDIVNDFYFSWLSLQLCRDIADAEGKDLSLKEMLDESEVLYLFKGKMK